MSDKHICVVSIHTPKFPLGQLVTTPNALENIRNDEMLIAIGRHANGDWGILDNHDIQANEQALKNGGRLLSAYLSSQNIKFYIITEHDRSYTTVMLPEDY
jgi:hypothetical protein